MYGRAAPDKKLMKIDSSDNNKETYLFKHGNGRQVCTLQILYLTMLTESDVSSIASQPTLVRPMADLDLLCKKKTLGTYSDLSLKYALGAQSTVSIGAPQRYHVDRSRKSKPRAGLGVEM